MNKCVLGDFNCPLNLPYCPIAMPGLSYCPYVNYYRIEFVVNTWQSKSIPWVLDRDVDKEVLKRVLEFLKSVKVPNRLPKYYSLPTSCPRYYKITVDNSTIDVIGWRYWYREPTKWGFKGYWHEVCQEELIEAIEELLGG